MKQYLSAAYALQWFLPKETKFWVLIIWDKKEFYHHEQVYQGFRRYYD